MVRLLIIFALSALLGCASGRGHGPVRSWSSYRASLGSEDPAFAFELTLQGLPPEQSAIGSWSRPLDVWGRVVKVEERSGAAVALRAGRVFRHTVIVDVGGAILRIDFDARGGSVPFTEGSRIHVRAHQVVSESGKALFLHLEDRDEQLLFAGIRAPAPDLNFFPPGWSLELGPTFDRAPLCDGHLYDKAVRVRSPWGLAVALPGAIMESEVGPDGAHYLIETRHARTSDATCARALREQGLSIVIRRLPSA